LCPFCEFAARYRASSLTGPRPSPALRSIAWRRKRAKGVKVGTGTELASKVGLELHKKVHNKERPMNQYLLFAAMPLICLAGCNRDNSVGNAQTTSADQPAPDNTKVNERDKNPTYTPLDQGNDSVDLDTTRRIRQSLIGDDTLSSDAKNIKIITNNGMVILRGPVKTRAERQKIEQAAVAVIGSNGRVDDEVEVESQ
jgi:hyperosmotically inducible protein